MCKSAVYQLAVASYFASYCVAFIDCSTNRPFIYRIAGNFREVQIFAIFATYDQNAKIRTAKYETAKI